MKIGDLVTFTPEVWGTPLEDRPLGIVMDVDNLNWPEMVTAIFPGDDIPYSSMSGDFEVVNENW